MGKKALIFSIVALLLSVAVNSYGQDIYEEKIRWQDNVGHVVYADSSQIMNRIPDFMRGCIDKGNSEYEYIKTINVNDSRYLSMCLEIGSGMPLWQIEIYKQVNDKWKLVAVGRVYRPCHAIRVGQDSAKNKLVFYTDKDKYGDKDEEVGELSLDKL